ncbi:MAG: molecular chaperone HtpG [Lachnospiraceae bacterium]|nr:molecular chaperone HtpG [Lachnospiraceae bacterium]
MNTEHGNLTMNSENMFPIIKKWLYSDHDIFFREMISNGCDAITKLKKLELMGETQLDPEEELRIDVTADAENKLLRFEDNGLGMTAEEVKKYINDIAFSGAADFLNTYKDKATEDQIIGHFGLGFYSAFMVADRVTIDTLSWQEGAEPVHWESEGGISFSLEAGDRTKRGTAVTLYLSEDSLQFANEWRAREVLEKYCAFMPYPIYLTDPNKKPEEPKTVKNADGTETVKEPEAPKPINDTEPLWLKTPSACTDDEYKAFYRKVFRDYKEPLFWIHLNMDYPFNLKGILYFPKLNLETEPAEGTVKLFSNQVFIADNIKEVIPEYLLLLKGTIDCPDLPLNVSRSALQNDGFVKKISDYITKKVADKLTGMFNVERENYEKYWGDIHPFIKYGCMKDNKFSDKMKKAVIYKDLDGKYTSLDEYLEAHGKAAKKDEEGAEGEAKTDEAAETSPETAEAEAPEEDYKDRRTVIYYVTDASRQAAYVQMFKKEGLNAFLFDHAIDEPFVTHLEMQYPDYHFCRIDSAVDKAFTEEMSEEETKAQTEQLTGFFRKTLNDDKLKVGVQRFKDASVASVMTLSEESRRMNEMMKMYGLAENELPTDETLVLNSGNPLVQYLTAHPESKNASLIAEQLYALALLGHRALTPEEMTRFAANAQALMQELIK